MTIATSTDEATIETRVRSAPDAEALKSVVLSLGGVSGSRGITYTADDLVLRIDAALLIPELAGRVTRAHGLRAKVCELARRVHDRRS